MSRHSCQQLTKEIVVVVIVVACAGGVEVGVERDVEQSVP